MAPQLPIRSWPEETPLLIATAPLQVALAKVACFRTKHTHLPGFPWPQASPASGRVLPKGTGSVTSVVCVKRTATLLQEARRLWLEVSDKDLVNSLKVCKLETLGGNT